MAHKGQHPDCFGCKVQTLSLQSARAFQPHFNYSVGSYVNTERQFKDTLNRRAEENSLITGTDHNYQMVDPADMARIDPQGDTEIIETSSRKWAEKWPQ